MELNILPRWIDFSCYLFSFMDKDYSVAIRSSYYLWSTELCRAALFLIYEKRHFDLRPWIRILEQIFSRSDHPDITCYLDWDWLLNLISQAPHKIIGELLGTDWS